MFILGTNYFFNLKKRSKILHKNLKKKNESDILEFPACISTLEINAKYSRTFEVKNFRDGLSLLHCKH